MSETICATGDSPGTTGPPAKWGWQYIAAAIVAGTALLTLAFLLVQSSNLQTELDRRLKDAEALSNHLGASFRHRLAALNATLFQFQLTGNDAVRDAFQRESRRISAAISELKGALPPKDERETLDLIEAAFQQYLSETDEILPIRGIRRDTAETVAATLESKLGPVNTLIERLAELQNTRRSAIRADSLRILQGLHENLRVAVAAVGALFASVLVLMYGAVIAPRIQIRTEQQTADERQAKLTSLGELASGVAHEIRNPLTAIKFRLFSLKKAFGGTLSENEDFQTIRNEIDRLERIVKSVLQFAKPPEPQRSPVLSTELLDHVHHLLEPEVSRKNARIIVDAGQAVAFPADRQQLEQVLINLSQNAAESLLDGGTITLRARSGAARLTSQPEPVVLLEVVDTGPGIPPEIQKRLFDPFFSTKEGGTGLGLAIASRIVERHGGRMHFSTTKDQGTTFTVLLPIEKHGENTNPADRR